MWGEEWGGENPLSDALMSDRDRALECPGVTLLGNQKVIGKRKVETLRVKPKLLSLKLLKEHNLVNLVLASAPLRFLSALDLQRRRPSVFHPFTGFLAASLPPLPSSAPNRHTFRSAFTKSAAAPFKSPSPRSSPHSHLASQLAGVLGGVSAPKLPTSSVLPGGILIGEMKGETHSLEGREWEVRSGNRVGTPQEQQS